MAWNFRCCFWDACMSLFSKHKCYSFTIIMFCLKGLQNSKATPETVNFSIEYKMLLDPDETRTRNLLIRSQTPYPLGHRAS